MLTACTAPAAVSAGAAARHESPSARPASPLVRSHASKPTISAFKASPSSFKGPGGTTVLTATVKKASSCSIAASPKQKGFPETVACAPLKVSVAVPANDTKSSVKHYYKLTASNSSGSASTSVSVKVGPATAPTVSGFQVAPSSLPFGGGQVAVTASVALAKTCTVSSSPALVDLPKVISDCGTVSFGATLPQDGTPHAQSYLFTLKATGVAGTTTKTATATVAAYPAPAVTSFTASNASLLDIGGATTLSASVSHATTCELTASSAVTGLPATIPCSAVSKPLTLPENLTSSAITYTFTLTATGPGGTTKSTTMAIVASYEPPQPVIDVSGTITQDTEWSPLLGDVYVIQGRIHVPQGVTLTIAPGAVVKSSGTGWQCSDPYVDGNLCIDGTLDAVGTSSDPITFTSINDNSVGGATGSGTPAAGDWDGLGVSDSGSIDLVHADVSYAVNGVDASGGTGEVVAVDNDVFVFNTTAVSVSASTSTNVQIEDDSFNENTVAIDATSTWSTVTADPVSCFYIPTFAAAGNIFEGSSTPLVTPHDYTQIIGGGLAAAFGVPSVETYPDDGWSDSIEPSSTDTIAVSYEPCFDLVDPELSYVAIAIPLNLYGGAIIPLTLPAPADSGSGRG